MDIWEEHPCFLTYHMGHVLWGPQWFLFPTESKLVDSSRRSKPDRAVNFEWLKVSFFRGNLDTSQSEPFLTPRRKQTQVGGTDIRLVRGHGRTPQASWLACDLPLPTSWLSPKRAFCSVLGQTLCFHEITSSLYSHMKLGFVHLSQLIFMLPVCSLLDTRHTNIFNTGCFPSYILAPADVELSGY